MNADPIADKKMTATFQDNAAAFSSSN